MNPERKEVPAPAEGASENRITGKPGEGEVSRRKRKRPKCPAGPPPGEPTGSKLEVRSLSGREVNVRREVDYITDCASRGETRIVTLGELVLFSTDRYAWMLDAEDGLAYCLMEDFERRDTPVESETGQGFAVAWDSEFTIDRGCFFTRSAAGKVTAWPAFPAEEIRKAVQRARSSCG